MVALDAQDQLSFLTCIELVMMKRGNVNYNLVLAKLQAYFDSRIDDCLDHPEYLKTVLKEVYEDDYISILGDISLETSRLEGIDKFKSDFFKFMMT